MTLTETLAVAGLTAPKNLTSGRWVRFPGVGKGRSNRSGWCRLITPTLAVYGDWSSGLSAVWTDKNHQDNEITREQLRQAQLRERQFANEQYRKQQEGAEQAQRLIAEATPYQHAYLARKGFAHLSGLVHGENLLIPVRDIQNHQLISVQMINGDGDKLFLPGARVRGGVHRLGAYGAKIYLCEGYATGLSIYEAAKRLHSKPATIVCFSANNLEVVARLIPQAIVCADNDASGVGERVARATSLPWIMPMKVGTDFNDLHLEQGIHAVIDMLRTIPA